MKKNLRSRRRERTTRTMQSLLTTWRWTMMVPLRIRRVAVVMSWPLG